VDRSRRRKRCCSGKSGLWLALIAVAGALLLEPTAASALTLRLYRARILYPHEAPGIWGLLRELSARAGLLATPVPHYVPSAVVNAFATGSKQEASSPSPMACCAT
jgi:heat shock protein HtpX